jgi:hypothetical protein
MLIYSPTPKRAWKNTIPWLNRDAYYTLDAQPSTDFGPNTYSLTPHIPSDVLDFINVVENLQPNYTPDTCHELLACLSSSFSGTCKSTPCTEGMTPTRKRVEDKVGCARAEKRRRSNKGAGEAQRDQTVESINSSCTDELCYRVLLHIFPEQGHEVVSALFTERVMAYQTKNNLSMSCKFSCLCILLMPR